MGTQNLRVTESLSFHEQRALSTQRRIQVISGSYNTPDTIITREQELSTLREELEAQEALRTKEREQKKATEEEKRKIEKKLRKSQQLTDQLKEDKEKLLQEKDKVRRSAEVEIERLKEELQ